MTGDTTADPTTAPDSIAPTQQLKAAIQAMDVGRSQVDILNALLAQCLPYGSRTAILILRNDAFTGWRGLGFTASGGNDEMIKGFSPTTGQFPELDRVRAGEVVRWDGVNLSAVCGVPASRQAVLVPMVIRDKLAAAVHVDATEADLPKFDDAAIQLLTYTAALLIDTLAPRTLSPTLG